MIHAGLTRLPAGILRNESLGSLPNDSSLDGLAEGFVAVMDSGMGGVSVLAALVNELPREDFSYFGDCANTPYGEKPVDWVVARTREIVDGQIGRGAKAAVIACNTATSAAAAQLRAEYPDIPIVGIEPALKPAAQALVGGRILVMATPMTLHLDKYQHLADEWGADCRVIPLSCDGLAAAIEHEGPESDEVAAMLESLLVPYRGGIDGVVLGCTHYPLAAAAIRRAAGGVPLFDGAQGTARQLRRVLEKGGLARDSDREGSVSFETSLGTAQAERALSELFREYRDTIPKCK